MVEIPVIYEDKNFIAVNKPSGLLVHGTKVNLEYSLADWLRKHYPETASVGDDPQMRPGVVHRLDKETSGVLIVARNQSSFEYLKSLFKKREIQKTYLALVRGEPKNKTGVIDSPIGIGEGTLKRSIHAERMKKEAHTEYHVKKFFENGGETVSLLEVFPKTGRTHQIRVHLASIGHPIVGDRLYGKKSGAKGPILDVHLMLHALSLEFVTEGGQRIKIEADPPPWFDRFMV